jgi:gamma-glutamylcyclotransferase (GGCT)/AIG2-like uncharacterized protein YtfP
MLYFAFGSNLSWKEMRRKCPHARMACLATLREHTFNFWVTSRDSVGGEMDIQGKKGQKVWGVVYHIDELEVGRLDQGEGFDPGSPHEIYERVELMVYDDDRDKSPLTIWTYRGTKQAERKKGNRPTAQYLKLIVEGAKHWRLPQEYVASLESVETHDA